MIQTINPTTGELIQSYQLMSWSRISELLTQSQAAYQQWRETDFATRKNYLLNLHDLLLQYKEVAAKLMTTEMGKPINQARAEIEKSALLCAYYAENAENFLAPRNIHTHYKYSYVCYEPIGTIFGIAPWNFPFWQVFRFLVPNLMAGNVAVLRHADCVMGCATFIEQLIYKAGYPQHVLQNLMINNELAAQIIADTRIAGVTLTGSERAGHAVASIAGQALKKVVLELGGSDPYIILADADLELAAESCVQSRLLNAGQVCVAAKRLIVEASVQAEFTRLVLEKAQYYSLGNPLNDDCQIGPLAREDLRANLHTQVQQCVQKGATLLLGGTLPSGPGFFYPVTILTNITPHMPAYCDELFGPVISIITANDETQALKIANDVRFGLGAAVFTRDIEKGAAIARYGFNAGTCVVNGMVSSDPRLPFGGTKSSGFGRELSQEGIHEFVNIKTVVIN